MNLMIESLKKHIEDSKLNIIEAYVEFFGEEYKERIIDRVSAGSKGGHCIPN